MKCYSGDELIQSIIYEYGGREGGLKENGRGVF